MSSLLLCCHLGRLVKIQSVIVGCCQFFTVVFISLSLLACGGGGGGGSDAGSPSGDSDDPVEADFNDVVVYESASPYRSMLKSCALAEFASETCLLSEVPLLSEEAASLSVDDIMDRVLVSHDWMGLRFRQALDTMPDEVLQLFAAITVVVIDSDIRPSYYLPGVSGIYLDPANLWLTNSEKSVISSAPDYRSEFDDDLSFTTLARYVDSDDYAWEFYSLNGSEVRAINDIRLPLAELLLHELMHANDYFPPDEAPFISQNQTIYQAFEALQPYRISDALNASQPLTSQLWLDLAAVMYLGDTASSQQRALTALQVGEALESDGASDDYGYATVREDVAMLFSEAMMKYLFDVDRDVGYTNRPLADNPVCDDYIVAWGMRSRIADSNVRDRAEFVVSAVYPSENFSLFFQGLAPPQFMRPGDDWCDNLVLP